MLLSGLSLEIGCCAAADLLGENDIEMDEAGDMEDAVPANENDPGSANGKGQTNGTPVANKANLPSKTPKPISNRIVRLLHTLHNADLW